MNKLLREKDFKADETNYFLTLFCFFCRKRNPGHRFPAERVKTNPDGVTVQELPSRLRAFHIVFCLFFRISYKSLSPKRHTLGIIVI